MFGWKQRPAALYRVDVAAWHASGTWRASHTSATAPW